MFFAPKYRRKVFFQEKREDIRDIFKTLCKWKGVDIIEGEICPDHIHLLFGKQIKTSAMPRELKSFSFSQKPPMLF